MGRRAYVIGGKPLGWRRFASARLGPVLCDWRWIRGTRHIELWFGRLLVRLDFGSGHKGTKSTTFGLHVEWWKKAS